MCQKIKAAVSRRCRFWKRLYKRELPTELHKRLWNKFEARILFYRANLSMIYILVTHSVWLIIGIDRP